MVPDILLLPRALFPNLLVGASPFFPIALQASKRPQCRGPEFPPRPGFTIQLGMGLLGLRFRRAWSWSPFWVSWKLSWNNLGVSVWSLRVIRKSVALVSEVSQPTFNLYVKALITAIECKVSREIEIQSPKIPSMVF